MSRIPHKQLKLALKATPSHGGRRARAGRPNISGRRAHHARPELSARTPVHVTLKLVEGLPSLRGKDLFRCLREAVRTARRRDLRVIHFAILSNHVHLIVEPNGRSLFRELQSLTVSLVRRINGLLKRGGAVLKDRYHLHVLRTPTETKRVLAYVLGNDAKHRGVDEIRTDPFSSAWAFTQWDKLYRKRPRLRTTKWSDAYVEQWHAEILSPARSWLLSRGWMRGR